MNPKTGSGSYILVRVGDYIASSFALCLRSRGLEVKAVTGRARWAWVESMFFTNAFSTFRF